MADTAKKPVKITETILRDAHQSLIATRMTTEQMLPIVDKIIRFGDSNLILSAVIGFDDFGAGMQVVFGLINLNHTLIGVFGIFLQLSQVFAFNLEIGIFASTAFKNENTNAASILFR